MPLKSRPPIPILSRIVWPYGADPWTVYKRRTHEIFDTSVSKPNAKGRYTKWLPCTHIKCESTSMCTWRPSPGALPYLEYKDWSDINDVPISSIYDYGLKQAYINLDFIEDNTFELIPFLMDWDDTIAMFSKKFLKDISYGSVTWGIMPFISDLKSLASSLDAINGKIASSYEKIVGKRITRRFNWSHKISSPWNPGALRYDITGRTVISGYLTGDNVYPDTISKALAVFLDEIGLNIDARTVWDVIPLSFVVDYFIPIGDLLESFHPRGWFNPQFSFSGGVSVTADIQGNWIGGGYSGGSSKYSLYKRDYLPDYKFGTRPPVLPEFTAPSFRELFNTAYLLKR